MAVRINPAKPVLWRNPTDLQIGVEAAVILEGVTPEQERLLALLERGIASEATKPEDLELIERINPALLLRTSEIIKPRLSGDFVRGAFAEIIRASYATNRNGIAVLEERAKVSILIDSLGSGGLLIALGLAAAGVGRILCEDHEVVGEHDLGPLGYPSIAKSSRRIEAANALLRERPGSSEILDFAAQTPAKRRHLLKVLIGQHAIHPARYRELVESKKPHLLVNFESERVSISPKITSSPCLGCLELHKTDADAAWPAIASQLLGRIDYLQGSRSGLFAAAIAVGEILRAIDSPEQEAEFQGARLQVASGRVENWSWKRHEMCDCG